MGNRVNKDLLTKAVAEISSKTDINFVAIKPNPNELAYGANLGDNMRIIIMIHFDLNESSYYALVQSLNNMFQKEYKTTIKKDFVKHVSNFLNAEGKYEFPSK